jgi:RimJ/RimL family protein N-acetyltransferase
MTVSHLIRPFEAADAEACRRLRLDALRQAPEAFGASHAEEMARPLSAFSERIAPAAPSLVFGALHGTALIGMAGFLASASEKSCHRGALWGVYVAPDARGQGLATALVKAVIAHASQHVIVLQARVVTTNAAAQRLYERLGFRAYGVEAKALRVDGAFFDEALLALDFTADD